MLSNIRKEILHTNHSAEITYFSVPPDWGTLIVDSIESHEDTEASNARISYNNVAETIIIRIMPTRLHECHSHWLHRVHRDWLRQNLVTLDQLDNIRVFYSPRQG